MASAASPIDFTQIAKGSSIQNSFYMWDAYLSGIYGFGGYQIYSEVNEWKPVPGGTAMHPSGVADTRIKQGEAFFVKGLPSGAPADFQLQIMESAKTDGHGISLRLMGQQNGQANFLRTSLHNQNGEMLDGAVVAFRSDYSDELDYNDVTKLSFAGENRSVSRNQNSLAIEARSGELIADTIFHNTTGLSQQAYSLVIAPENMLRKRTITLVDHHLNHRIDLSATDTSEISVCCEPRMGSNAKNRFYIILRSIEGVLPMTFTKVSAQPDGENVAVKWTVGGETAATVYTIERSLSGSQFERIATVLSQDDLAGNYSFIDKNAPSAMLYYRVKTTDSDGKVQFSNVAKVNLSASSATIDVLPNPVIEDRIKIRFTNCDYGNYDVSIMTSTGQVLHTQSVKIDAFKQVVEIKRGSILTKGIYTLVVRQKNQTLKTEMIRLL